MRLIRVGDAGAERPGLLLPSGQRVDATGAGLGDYDEAFFGGDGIATLAAWAETEADGAPTFDPSDRLGPPIARPSKLVCVGLNFRDHAAETGQEPPTDPALFFKSTTAMVGPDDDLVLPRGSVKTDWEVELAVVIGATARYVSEASALDHVAGYVLHNDYSEREFQLERGAQWDKGKGCDTFAPLGPFLATPDEVGAAATGLAMWLTVNDVPRQRSNTDQMVFGVAELVSRISGYMTLLPGDVISTGTPGGVALSMDPPPYLEEGDVVRLGIDGLGESTQHVPRAAVTRLALGCAPLGNLYRATTDDGAQATVDAAWDRGIRFFDTAPLYGHGLSEVRTGRSLRARPRDEYVLSTKVGRLLVPDAPGTRPDPTIFEDIPPVHPVPDFSADGVRRSIEESLGRLGLDRVDVAHLHDPDDHLDQALGEAHPALVRLRDEGVIGAIGVGTNHAQVAARFVGAVDLDWVLLAGRHTLLEQTGTPELFPRCQELGIRVLAAAVLNSGILADPAPGARYDYAPASAEVLARAQRMQAICARHGVPLLAAALQFPLRHPAVDSVLVGAGTPAEVDEDARLLEVPIPDACWDELGTEGVPLS